MSKSNTFENALLLLIFNNTPIAGIGDAGGLLASATAGNLWLALYVADPGEGGSAVTNETTYVGYTRMPLVRSASGWVVTGNSVSPVADVIFGGCTASPGTDITHFGVVNTASGAGVLLYFGELNLPVEMAVDRAPKLKSQSTITED